MGYEDDRYASEVSKNKINSNSQNNKISNSLKNPE
jgi:hypothetical protein